MFVRTQTGKTITAPTGWSTLGSCADNGGSPGKACLYTATASASGNNNAGQAITWSTTGTDMRFGLSCFPTPGGVTATVDVSNLTTAASNNNASTPSITTTGTDELIVGGVYDDTGSAVSAPTALTTIFSGNSATSMAEGYIYQHSAAASAQQNFTDGSAAWFVWAVALVL
jgi:hypothetical protein